MTIKSITEREGPIEIDLTGPDGNSFALMGKAKELCNLLNERRGADYLDYKAIQAEMRSDDYEHLLEVMEKYFGHIIIMYR
jgi:hypothetical protein